MRPERTRRSHIDKQACLHVHYAFRFSNPMTRAHVRLLGPCFKTGQLGYRQYTKAELPLTIPRRTLQQANRVLRQGSQLCRRNAPSCEPSGHSYTSTVEPTVRTRRLGTQFRRVGPAITGPHSSFTAFGAHSWEMHPRDRSQTHGHVRNGAWSQGVPPQQAESQELTSGLTVCFQSVSRPLELSLQSSLQLSLTVLVCYRSRGYI